MATDREQQRHVEALLAEYQNALIAGRPVTFQADLPESLAQQLRAAQQCVDRLHSLWMPGGDPGDLDEDHDPRAEGEVDASGAEGSTIGRFEVERELGHGGAGLVLLARDPKLGRRVALKVPRPEALMSRAARQRFLREAEAAARLSHPHIVAVYEVGEAGPVCYIAQEYCAGPSLAGWLAARSTRASVREAAEVVATLAAAVHHAHVRGVLHRDLKPSNVLLDRSSPSSDEPFDSAAELPSFIAKVSDFGLAKLLECEGDETRTGTVLGTPRYMAPEQAEGRVRDVGVHTDVYALGAILYELLTGAPPHCGTTETDTLRRVLLDEPVPPRRTRPEVSHDLQSICLKALEKSLPRRYATAAAMEEDLRRYLAGRPTFARPVGVASRAWKWARRRPAIAGLAGVLAAALATIFVGTLVYSIQLQKALDVASSAGRRSRQLLYTADVRRAHATYQNAHVAQVLEILEGLKPREGEEDRREFSWYLLKGLCNQQLSTLVGHKEDVFSVACSSDGRMWASGGKDKTVRLWDTKTQKPCGILNGHTGEVTCVRFAPSGEMLASASEDHTVRIWHSADDTQRQVLAGHADHVLCLAFSPNGKWLASGSRDNTVRVWDVAKGDVIARLEGNAKYLSSITFTRRGDLLVAGDGNGDVLAWKTDDWQPLNTLSHAEEKMLAIAASPQRDWLAGAGRLNVVHLWETADDGLRPIFVLKGGHATRIQALAFSPRDATLASADNRGVIQLWDTDQLGQRKTLLGHVDRVWSLAWSPDGQMLASGGAGGTIRVWNPTARPDGAYVYSLGASEPADVSFSPRGDLLFATCLDATIHWFDTNSHRLVEIDQTYPDKAPAVCISPDNTLVATRRAGATSVWTRNGKHQRLVVPEEGSLDFRPLAWSPDGHHLATTTSLTTAVLVDVRLGQIVYRVHTSRRVMGLAFSRDGRQLAVSADRLRIWNPRTEELLLDLDEAEMAAQFSANGQILAAKSGGEIRIHETHTGRVLRRFINDTMLFNMALSPDGQTLAGGVRVPPSIILWDVNTGQELMTLEPDGASLNALMFSPLGDRLVATGVSDKGEGQIWEWAIPSDAARRAP